MLRIVLGVVVGFIAWLITWLGGEKLAAAIWPAFGVHQAAFQSAIENGSRFTADTGALLTHIVLGSIASVIAGFLAELIARGSKRAPMILGCLLLAVGLLKAAMSWSLVPIWYHVLFTGILLPMAVVGGKLRATP